MKNSNERVLNLPKLSEASQVKENDVNVVSLYLRVILNMVFIFVSLGIIGPYLISAKDTILVVVGVIYLMALPLVIYLGNRKFANKLH